LLNSSIGRASLANSRHCLGLLRDVRGTLGRHRSSGEMRLRADFWGGRIVRPLRHGQSRAKMRSDLGIGPDFRVPIG